MSGLDDRVLPSCEVTMLLKRLNDLWERRDGGRRFGRPLRL
jgi:hypothetical protein